MAHFLQLRDSEKRLGLWKLDKEMDQLSPKELVVYVEGMEAIGQVKLDENVLYEIRISAERDGDTIRAERTLWRYGRLHLIEDQDATPVQSADQEGAGDGPEPGNAKPEREWFSSQVRIEVVHSDSGRTLLERDAVHTGAIYTVPVAEIVARWHQKSVIELTEGTRYTLAVKEGENVVWSMYYTLRGGQLVAD